jgi:hypothetical protein
MSTDNLAVAPERPVADSAVRAIGAATLIGGWECASYLAAPAWGRVANPLRPERSSGNHRAAMSAALVTTRLSLPPTHRRVGSAGYLRQRCRSLWCGSRLTPTQGSFNFLRGNAQLLGDRTQQLTRQADNTTLESRRVFCLEGNGTRGSPRFLAEELVRVCQTFAGRSAAAASPGR